MKHDFAAGRSPVRMWGWSGMEDKPLFDRKNLLLTFKKLQKYVLLLFPAGIRKENCMDDVMTHTMQTTYGAIEAAPRKLFIYNMTDYKTDNRVTNMAGRLTVRGNVDAIGQIAQAMENAAGEGPNPVFSAATTTRIVANPPLPLQTVICKQRV